MTKRISTADSSDQAPKKVSIDEEAARWLSASKLNQVKNVFLEGIDLVEHSLGGFFIGLVDGQLIIKLQLRLPVKKTLLFAGSLAALIWIFWTRIYPYLEHVQIVVN